MAAAVPGSPDAAEDDEMVEEIDDLAGLPVDPPGEQPRADGERRPGQRQLSPRCKARPQPPAHSPPAHRHWEAAAGGTL
eukprot:11119397-Alexandrium_andersonii.AAC.1